MNQSESHTPQHDEAPMKPIVIIKKGCMSPEDIKLLRDNGLCAVEATDTSTIRFMEPVPLSYTDQQRAAIELSRILITEGVKIDGQNRRHAFATMFADILMRSEPLKGKA